MSATFLCSSSTDTTPVLKCSVNGTSALLECGSTDNATKALCLTGILLSGHILHVHRPNEYAGPDTLSMNWHQLMASISSLDVSEFKLFYIWREITDELLEYYSETCEAIAPPPSNANITVTEWMVIGRQIPKLRWRQRDRKR